MYKNSYNASYNNTGSEYGVVCGVVYGVGGRGIYNAWGVVGGLRYKLSGNLWYLQLENKSKTLIPSTVPGKISNIKTRCFFTFQSSWEWIFYEINFWKREVRIFMC